MPPLNEYRSLIYYHEDKPQWYETFKVAIPIEEFKTSHLKFIFKHRSSSEAKDKSEKPFAMSYVRLMQNNGTTLKDSNHNLIVYKIDHKKFNDSGVDYFNLASTVYELRENNKKQHGGLTYSSKDSFVISSNICSTKLTQNGNYRFNIYSTFIIIQTSSHFHHIYCYFQLICWVFSIGPPTKKP